MPSVVVDSVLVEAGWDPSALERGLAQSERLVQEFSARTGGIKVAIKVDEPSLSGLLEGFGQKLPPLSIDTTQLQANLATAGDSIQRFFASFQGGEVAGVVGLLRAIDTELQQIGQRGFLDLAITEAKAMQVEVGATTSQAQKLQAVINDLKTPAPIGLNVDPAVTASTTLINALGLTQRTAATTRDLLSQPINIAIGGNQLALLAGQLQQAERAVVITKVAISDLTATMAQGTTGAQALAAGMARLSVIGRENAARLGVQARLLAGLNEAGAAANLKPFARGLEEIRLTGIGTRAELNAGVVAFGKHAIGARGAASALSALAAQSVGATGPIGALAQNILLLSGGLGVTAAVAAGVLAVVKAYEFLNTAQREAQKTQDALVAGLLTEANSMSAAEKAARGLVAALQAKAAAESAGRRVTDLLKGGALEAVGLPGAGAEFARRQQEEVANATRAITQAQKDVTKAFSDTHAAEVAALTEGISLRIATTKEIQRGADFLPILTRLSEDTNRPLVERIAFLKELTGLEAARAAIPSAAPGDAAIVALGRQVAVLQIGEAAVKRLEAAQAALFAGQRTGIGVLDDVRARLQRQKDAHDEAAKAAAKQGAELRDNLADAIQVVTDALNKLGDADPFTKLLAKQRKAFKAPDLGDVSLSSTGISGGFDRAAAAADDIGKALTKAAAASNKFFAKAKKDAEDTRTAIQKFNDSIHEITRGADGILGAAVNVGLIGDEAANAIGSVLNLADALGNLAESASTGNILGAIGAGIGFVGGLFAKDPAAAALEDATRQNSARLEELSAVLKASALGVGGQQKVGQAATALGRFPEITGQINAGALFDPSAIARLVNELLAGPGGVAGVTFADLQKAADTAGITLVKDGQLVGGAFIDLATAVGFSIDAMTHFTSSFADQVSFADLTAKINGGLGDAVDQFQRDLSAAGAVKSTFIADFFKGIDIRGDAAGFQKRLQELLKLFAPDSDFFKNNPTLLGGLTVEDWKKLLNDGADAMELLTDATTKAQKSLGDLNVPQGFRRAAIAFQTGDTGPGVDLAARTAAVANLFPKDTPVIKPLPDDAQALLDQIAKKTPDDLLSAVTQISDLLRAGQIPVTGFDAAATPGSPSVDTTRKQTVTVTFGDIIINIQGDRKDAQQIAEETVRELRRKAMAQSGDTLQLGFT